MVKKEIPSGTMISITKVVSRNFIVDWVAKFQNLIGINLTVFERMADKGMEQIRDEIAKRNLKLKWYHFQITQLTNGALSITMYGEKDV